MTHFSPTARYALGLRSDYMREDKAWLHTITYDRLLKRWNFPSSQANIFLQTGLGVGQQEDETAPAASGGILADWENRRLLIAYENRMIISESIDQSFSHKGRLGIAPYIGDYDDIHTWLMLEVDHHPTERDNVVLTPFIRVFTTSLMTELGISDQKDILFNISLQF